MNQFTKMMYNIIFKKFNFNTLVKNLSVPIQLYLQITRLRDSEWAAKAPPLVHHRLRLLTAAELLSPGPASGAREASSLGSTSVPLAHLFRTAGEHLFSISLALENVVL